MTSTRTKPIAFALLLSPVVVIAIIAMDARARQAERGATTPAIDAVSRRLPAGDLALSGGARWLRSPSLEEPGAAFADGPASPDPDPAGGAMAPPREVWGNAK